MKHLRRLLQFKSLSCLIVGASFGLSILTVIAVAQTPRTDQVSALAVSGNTTKSVPNGSSHSLPTSGSRTTASGTATPKHSPVKANDTTATASPDPAAKPTAGGGPAKTTAPAPTASPVTTVVSPAGTWKYPLHSGIKTTWFYAGEPASADNGFIQNVSSAWQDDWQAHFGGSDNPDSRCGYNPCAFMPLENPFYFALPFSDYTASGPVADLSMVPWNTGPLTDGMSLLKNRWIQITAAPGGTSKTVYAQWEDVGPFQEHDSAYVFGSAAPSNTQGVKAGLDVSPATRDYLGQAFKDSGSTLSSWRFVDYSEVPAGPWKTTITNSGPAWN